MWLFSLMLLSIALVVPFLITAVAGWTGSGLEDKRARLRGMFGFGCIVYAMMVGICVSAGWANNADCHPQLILLWMFLWGIPLASSGTAVLVLGRKPPPSQDLPDIGFSASGQ